METAKIFKNGRSQAVRLPKEFRFDGEEVFISKIKDMVILTPKKNPWQSMIDSMGEFSDDFMIERNQPTEQQIRENL